MSLDYPEFDLCAPLGERRPFDVVICEQVLEHVADPWTAAENLRGLCAPGGHVDRLDAVLVRVHELPEYGMHDYWRFTPRGLRHAARARRARRRRVELVGQPGVRRRQLDRWPAYRRWNSLRNEPDLPLQVWAFASA